MGPGTRIQQLLCQELAKRSPSSVVVANYCRALRDLMDAASVPGGGWCIQLPNDFRAEAKHCE